MWLCAQWLLHPEFYVITPWSPWIPEMFQTADEIWTGSIHPGHFVNEYNFPAHRKGFQIVLQDDESIQPWRCSRQIGITLFHALHKVLQLHAHGNIVHTCHVEGIIAAYDMLYKKCLANTPAALNGNELRLVGIDVLIQQLLFLLPANKKLVHHHTIFDAAKVQIKTYTTKQNARNLSRMYIFGYVRDRFRAFMPLYSS